VGVVALFLRCRNKATSAPPCPQGGLEDQSLRLFEEHKHLLCCLRSEAGPLLTGWLLEDVRRRRSFLLRLPVCDGPASADRMAGRRNCYWPPQWNKNYIAIIPHLNNHDTSDFNGTETDEPLRS
jgi:hypothetical protein